MTHDIKTKERALWLEGAPQFRRSMSADCVMVFPEPVGILRGEAILTGLDGAPRWKELSMRDVALVQPMADVVVIAYRVEARREEGEPYHALCSSIWVQINGEWRIVQHQHTPTS